MSIEDEEYLNKWLEETRYYFFGALESIDDDLPDGAWFAMHEDIAEDLINDACECVEMKRPRYVDGNDITHYYLEHLTDSRAEMERILTETSESAPTGDSA